MSQLWKAATTETYASVREATDEPRTIEGVAVPYGQIARDTEFGAEAFAPGAFRASVEHWMGRTDGARMAFRSAHGQPPIGVVTSLTDTAEGVSFRASIKEGPAGDEYLSDVRSGLNGVSVEAGLPKGSKRGRDGTVIHREARLFAIAGSVTPAYDGARIALRDMEDSPVDENETTTELQDTETRDASLAERQRVEIADVQAMLPVGNAPARVIRSEPVYGPRSDHSFLKDAYRADQGDSEARERMSRHQAHLTDVSHQIERAGDVLIAEIPGAYPNDYLPGLLTPRILKGRPFGGYYQRVPISDARPRIFAKVTTSGAVVTAADGAALTATDIATTAVTTTPAIYGAYTDVSRAVIDGADPSAQSMVIQDLIEAYAQASETVIKTAVEAGSTASGVAITAATPFAGTLANVINYQAVRFNPATGVFIPSALYSVLLAQGDTTGRPFLPQVGLMNSDGSVMAGATSANILGAQTALSWASTANVCVFARPSDFVIFESSIAQFTFSEIVGPQAVRIGLWAYLGVGTRLGSLKVTAA